MNMEPTRLCDYLSTHCYIAFSTGCRRATYLYTASRRIVCVFTFKDPLLTNSQGGYELLLEVVGS